MSGRALYPVTMNLYDKLAHEFDGDLHVSYSAGADALNIATILSCGALPVTACSDLLKPGGYRALRRSGWRTSRRRCRRAALTISARSRRTGWRTSKPPRPRRWRTRATRRATFVHGLPKVKSGLEPVRLRRRAVRGGVRGRAGRAGVRLADRAGRPRPCAGSDPRAQPAAGRDRLCLHAPLPDRAARATTTRRPSPSGRSSAIAEEHGKVPQPRPARPRPDAASP